MEKIISMTGIYQNNTLANTIIGMVNKNKLYSHDRGQLKLVTNPDGSITISAYDERAEKRKKWIERFTRERLVNGAKIEVLGHSTAVSYKDYYGTIHLGISHPSPKDEYDKDIGIAVAMAKAMGQSIPDYI